MSYPKQCRPWAWFLLPQFLHHLPTSRRPRVPQACRLSLRLPLCPHLLPVLRLPRRVSRPSNPIFHHRLQGRAAPALVEALASVPVSGRDGPRPAAVAAGLVWGVAPGAAPAAAAGLGLLPFSGKPVSPSLVGPALAVMDALARRYERIRCFCFSKGTSVMKDPHFTWECPVRFYSNYGRCPGFQADGSRDPAAWVNDDITAATKQDWIDFIASQGLSSAVSANGAEVNFS